MPFRPVDQSYGSIDEISIAYQTATASRRETARFVLRTSSVWVTILFQFQDFHGGENPRWSDPRWSLQRWRRVGCRWKKDSGIHVKATDLLDAAHKAMDHEAASNVVHGSPDTAPPADDASPASQGEPADEDRWEH